MAQARLATAAAGAAEPAHWRSSRETPRLCRRCYWLQALAAAAALTCLALAGQLAAAGQFYHPACPALVEAAAAAAAAQTEPLAVPPTPRTEDFQEAAEVSRGIHLAREVRQEFLMAALQLLVDQGAHGALPVEPGAPERIPARVGQAGILEVVQDPRGQLAVVEAAGLRTQLSRHFHSRTSRLASLFQVVL